MDTSEILNMIIVYNFTLEEEKTNLTQFNFSNNNNNCVILIIIYNCFIHLRFAAISKIDNNIEFGRC